MKQTTFKFASRLMVVALAVCMIMGTMACSKDEEPAGIVGEWVRQDGKSNASFEFFGGGTGHYESGGTTWGEFDYQFKDNQIYIDITYSDTEGHGVWRSEIKGQYMSHEDEIWMLNKVWVRKK